MIMKKRSASALNWWRRYFPAYMVLIFRCAIIVIIMSDLLESLSSLLIYSRLTTQRCVIYENVCTVSSAVRARTWVCLNSPLTSVHLCSVAQPSIRCLAKLFKKASKKACLRALRKEFGKRSKRMQSSSNLSRHQRCSNNTYFVTTYVCCFLT